MRLIQCWLHFHAFICSRRSVALLIKKNLTFQTFPGDGEKSYQHHRGQTALTMLYCYQLPRTYVVSAGDETSQDN